MSDPATMAIWAQVTALEMTVIAMINTHPDPKALAKELRAAFANLQVSAASSGAPTTPEPVRLLVDRMLRQIDARIH